MHIFADGFTRVSLSGGVVRLTLVQNGADNQSNEVGELLIPAVKAEQFVKGLEAALRKLSEQVQQEQQAAQRNA
ncbi:hypothetical protein [Synechococcus elongatus]|uniref:Uncharacterized protein n=1 Tax=Synechococcus elongatus PCC 11801 TaxID=2219813 RepID=A0AAQ3MDI2_SYNEL|nr:hypothetical protein [Synechococcus elongatus]